MALANDMVSRHKYIRRQDHKQNTRYGETEVLQDKSTSSRGAYLEVSDGRSVGGLWLSVGTEESVAFSWLDGASKQVLKDNEVPVECVSYRKIFAGLTHRCRWCQDRLAHLRWR